MKKIKLTQGKFALVDDGDYAELSQYKWHIKNNRGTLYVQRTKSRLLGKGSVLMHRQIMSAPKGQQVDHINHNGLDNRRDNLRICSNAENQHNRLSFGGTSKYKGIYWEKRRGKWRAEIKTGESRKYLGSFLSEIDAAKEYDKAAIELYGEFAYLNFPKTDGTGGK